MYKIFIFVIFIIFSLNVPAANIANERARNDERIINGREVREGDAEWVVSIRNHKGHFCGGSLVSPVLDNNGTVNGWRPDDNNPEWVITAAHCFADQNGNTVDTSLFKVLSGVLSLENSHEGELHTIEGVFIHPDYNQITLANDIAVLKISYPRKILSVSKRSSIRLPKISDGLWLNQPYVSLFTAGWGRTEYGFASSRLLEAQIPRVEHDFCQEKFTPYGKNIHSGPVCQPNVEPADFEITSKSGHIRSQRCQNLKRITAKKSVPIPSWRNVPGAFSLLNINYQSCNKPMPVSMVS